MNLKNAVAMSLGMVSVKGSKYCETRNDCNMLTYGAGGCCLNEEEHWAGDDNSYV